MATINFAARLSFAVATTADDGRVSRAGAVYPPDGSITYEATDSRAVRSLATGTYTVRISLLKWDTSSLPNNGRVKAGSLAVTLTARSSADSRSMRFEYRAWAGDSSDYEAEPTPSSSLLANETVIGSLAVGANTLTLSNLGNISKTGTTYLKGWITGSTPAGANIVTPTVTSGKTDATLTLDVVLPVEIAATVAAAGTVTHHGAATVQATAGVTASAVCVKSAAATTHFDIAASTDDAMASLESTLPPESVFTTAQTVAAFNRVMTIPVHNYAAYALLKWSTSALVDTDTVRRASLGFVPASVANADMATLELRWLSWSGNTGDASWAPGAANYSAALIALGAPLIVAPLSGAAAGVSKTGTTYLKGRVTVTGTPTGTNAVEWAVTDGLTRSCLSVDTTRPVTIGAAVTAAGACSVSGSATITVAAAATAVATVIRLGVASVTVTGTVSAVGSLVVQGSGAMAAACTVAASATLVTSAAATAAAACAVTAVGAITVRASGACAATATVSASAWVGVVAAGTITCAATVSANGRVSFPVTLATTPDDTLAAETPNLPLFLHLSGSRVLDEADLAVALDGVTYSVASGNLKCWANGDGKELYVTLEGVDYWSGPGVTHSYTVTYGLTSWDRTFLTGSRPEGIESWAVTGFCTLGAGCLSTGTDAEVVYLVGGLESAQIRGDLGYAVVVGFGADSDVEYMVGALRIGDVPAAGIVGSLQQTDQPASGIVRGWQAQDVAASGVVRAWVWTDLPAAGYVSVTTIRDLPAAGIVGTVSLTSIPASGIVRGVNRRNAIDVQTIDPAVYNTLAGSGTTWS